MWLLMTFVLIIVLIYSKRTFKLANSLYYVHKLKGPRRRDIFFGSFIRLGLLGQDGMFSMMQKWNLKYFPIYKLWIGPVSGVHIVNPNDVELITSNIKHIKKDFTYDFLHRWLGTGLLTSDGEKWQVRRKILTSSFHFNILQNFVPIFNEETDFLVKILEEECENGSTNVVPLVSQFALKTIAETSMGTKLKFDSEKERNYKKAINDIVQVFMHRLFRPWLIPIFFYIFFPTYYQERRLVKTLHNFTEEVIEDREKNFQEISEGTNPKKRRLAMLDLLLSAKLIDGSIDQEGIREEVDTFMFEGHDTTTTAISFALMLLACHPEVQDEILKETIEILGDDLKKKPSLQDLQDMRYLERCIKEVLRLYPSVYFIGRKLGEDMTTFTGYKLKKNTSVVMQIYGMHHSPEIYEDPEKFDPDRFLPENCQNRHPFAYIPFSAGPRNCIGQRFALLEVKAVICGIVRNFVLEPVDTPKTVVLTADIILRTKFGIRVKFKRRV